jgi:F-type H+-transporting ATPase subunit a
MTTFASIFERGSELIEMGNAKAFFLHLPALRTLVAAILLTTSFGAVASEPAGTHEEESFNAGEYIIHHIADAHSIHLFGKESEGIPEVSIPLPVILWTDNGLAVFMSSAFHHDTEGRVVVEANGQRFVNYHEKILYANDAPDEHGSYASIDHETHKPTGAAPLDFSITKTVFGMLLIMVLMVFIFISVAKAYTRREGQAPTGLQNFLEPLIIFIRDEVAVPSIGKKKADKFMPFLLTVFFFIWMSNMLGLIPFIGGFNVTGTMGVTLVLALFVFIITSINGNKHYWGHLFNPPGVPGGIKLILVPIEILGMFIKPSVLMIRLTANITAGHIAILAFVSLILIFNTLLGSVAGYGMGVFSTAFMIFMFFLELLVAFLQAYVFTLLAALYFGDATHEAHH